MKESMNKELTKVLRGVNGERISVLKFLSLTYLLSLRLVISTYIWIIKQKFPKAFHDVISKKQVQNSMVPFLEQKFVFLWKKVWNKLLIGLSLVWGALGDLYFYCLNILQFVYIYFAESIMKA